jgi:hypothetical protein
MGRNRKELDTTSKVAGQLSFAALAKALPRALVEEQIDKAMRKQKRDRLLPARLMVYYTLAMCVYSQVGVEQVLRWVLEQARQYLGAHQVKIATSGAISSARKRLGSEVLEALYRRVAAPLAHSQTKGAWHQGLRLVALDGSTLDLQDTDENAAHYGYTNSRRGKSAYPKLRFAALVETGTHALLGAHMGAYVTSEQALGARAIESLGKGMLCMADRLFYGYEFWGKALQTGAHLLWRVKKNLRLPVEQALPDGSYLSTLYANESDRRKKRNGHRVRVIAYRLQGKGAPAETYRLITTLLDWEKHPAAELAALYPQRWEIEIALDEFKTHLRGGQVVLRSKTPELVRQEFYAYMLAHYCVRQLMHEAALLNEVEPVRMSYKHAVEVLKRKLPAYEAGFSPKAHGEAARGDDTGDSGENPAQARNTQQPARREAQDERLQEAKSRHPESQGAHLQAVPDRNKY